jgi:phenylalanine-4-hydroxylase
MNIFTEPIPDYLNQYIATQDYSAYTAIDHACWRHIMRLNASYFAKHAHPKYLDGLREFGISIERIPHISEMDEKLKKFGWRAIAVTGFIPPAEFMEMLALSILPIACDMRKIENIDYTPSPDIVHEAAGHAPIIADKGYAQLLHKNGEIARRAIYAKEDNLVYEAVLHLSETKEDPASTEADIIEANRRLDMALKSVNYVSEAQQLTRFAWWSTEYGLYMKDGKYLIYGAGLLSSAGESYYCLNDSVKKMPLTIDCVNHAFDITKPQPQLFCTDDFAKLDKISDELASTMAFKQGGTKGLYKAQRAETVTTVELETGLQISGVVSEYRDLQNEVVFYVKLTGPCQISYDEKQIESHGPKYHTQGFSSPLGRIKGLNKPTHKINLDDLVKLGIQEGKEAQLEFEPGIKLVGVFTKALQQDGKLLLLSFERCTVKLANEVLFSPEWGTFDLALGEKVVSVFGGAADRDAYVRDTEGFSIKARKQKTNLTEENMNLVPLYQKVRDFREAGHWNANYMAEVKNILVQLDVKFKDDWLLRFEILELLNSHNAEKEVCAKIEEQLTRISASASNIKMLVDRGFELLAHFKKVAV